MEFAQHKIQALSDDVRSMIRTGVALTSFAQAVEELVLNAVDAKASSIAVRIDLSCFKVQVVDNGEGISLDQFEFIGERYSTSKCHSAEDLDNLKYYGYRGEALASLQTASTLFEIISRPKNSCTTYSKCFRKGDCLGISQPSQHRPSHGTTITAYGLFYNLPVRRNGLNTTLETEKIRYRLAGIALMWPKISISLRDDSVGNVILQTQKCSGTLAIFSQLFTPARAKGLMEVSIDSDDFKISGLVSKESYSRKDLQFVFVNKRLVLKSSIHKQVNKIFRRSLVLKRKGTNFEELEKMHSTSQIGFPQGSPSKQVDQYAIFVLNIDCSFREYDITFDPSKTLVEFRDWPKLIYTLQDMLYGFLRKENLLPPNSYSPSRSDVRLDGFEKVSLLQHRDDPNKDKDKPIDNLIAPQQFNMTNLESMFSEPVSRPNLEFVGDGTNIGENIPTVEGTENRKITKESIVDKDFQINTVKRKVCFDVNKQSSQVISENVSQSNNSDSRLSRIISLKGNNFNSRSKVGACSLSSQLSKNIEQQRNQGQPSKALSSSGMAKSSALVDEEEPLTRISGHVENVSEHPLKVNSNSKQHITLSKAANYTSTMKGLRDINPFRTQTTSPNISQIMLHTLQDLKMCSHKQTMNSSEMLKTPEKATRRKSLDVEQGSSLSKHQRIERNEKSQCFMSSNGDKRQMIDSKDEMQIDYFHISDKAKDVPETMWSASSSVPLYQTDTFSTDQSSAKGMWTKEKENPRRPARNKISHSSKLAKIMQGIDKSEKEQSSKHMTRLKSFTYAKEDKYNSTDSTITQPEPDLWKSNFNKSFNIDGTARISLPKEIMKETERERYDNSSSTGLQSNNVTTISDTSKHHNTTRNSQQLPFAMYKPLNETCINTPKLSVLVSIPISVEQDCVQASGYETNVEEHLHIDNVKPMQLNEVPLLDLPRMTDKKVSAQIDEEDRLFELSQGFDVGSAGQDPSLQSCTPFVPSINTDSNKKAYFSQGFYVRNGFENSPSTSQETESNSPCIDVDLQIMAEKSLEDPHIEINESHSGDSCQKKGNENNWHEDKTTKTDLQCNGNLRPLTTKTAESDILNSEIHTVESPEMPSQRNLIESTQNSHTSHFKNAPIVDDSLSNLKRTVAPEVMHPDETASLNIGIDSPCHGIIFSGETQISLKRLKVQPFTVTKNGNSSDSVSALGVNCQQKHSSIEDMSCTSGNKTSSCIKNSSDRLNVCEENIDAESSSSDPGIPCGQKEVEADNSSNSSIIPCGQSIILKKYEAASLSSLSSSSLNVFASSNNLSTDSVIEIESNEKQNAQCNSSKSQNKDVIQNDGIETDATERRTGLGNESCQKAFTVSVNDLSPTPCAYRKKTLISLSNARSEIPNPVSWKHSLTVTIPDSTVEDKIYDEDGNELDSINVFTTTTEGNLQETLHAQGNEKSDDTEGAKTQTVLAIPDSVSPAVNTNADASKNSREKTEALTHWCRVTPSASGMSVYVNNKSGHSISEEQWLKLASPEQDFLMADNSKSTDQDLSEITSGANENIKSGQNMNAFSKWRDEGKLTYDVDKGGDVASVITTWTETVFLKYKLPSVLSLYNRDENTAKSSSHTLNQVEFTKEMLQNVELLGQVDNKFLACIIRKRNIKSKDDNSSRDGTVTSPLLVLFDQHAVHERIRLELLTSEVYESSEETAKERIKREQITHPIALQLNQDDVRVMRAFAQEFDRIGVEFAVVEGSREKIVIHTVPLCMTESKRIKGALKEKIEELISEHIDLLKSTNGTCGKLPLAIHRVLCSQACRGAIKFGDPLSQNECGQLLSQLPSCNLPFQCAHGRPSIAPLINLSDLDVEPKDLVKRPRLQNITRLMKSYREDKTQKNLEFQTCARSQIHH